MPDFVFSCPECRGAMKLPAVPPAGKRVRCPRCKTVFVPPAPVVTAEVVPVGQAAEEETFQPGPPVHRPPVEEADDVTEVRPRRRRRQSGPSIGLILGLVAGGVFLLLLGVGGVAFFLYRAAGRPSATTPAPVLALASQWQEFVFGDGNGSVLMPGRPQPMPNPAPDAAGVRTQKYGLTLQGGQLMYIAATIDVPEQALQVVPFDQFVAAERDQVIKAMKGRAASETPVTLNGHQGKEFQVVAGNGAARMIERLYLVRRPGAPRFYLVAVAGDHLPADDADAKKFFDSFHIREGGTTAPKAPGKPPAAPPDAGDVTGQPPPAPDAEPNPFVPKPGKEARPFVPRKPPAAPKGKPAKPGSVPQAVRDLASGDLFARKRAAELLAAASPDDQLRPEVLRALEPAADDADPFVRRAAVKALGVWGQSETVPVLIRVLSHQDVFTRREALTALGRFPDERAADAVAKAMSDFHQRHQASEALRAMGSVAEPAVRKLLAAPDAQLRAEACRVLADIGTRACLPDLRAAAAGKDFFVKNAAADALKKLAARGVK
jgi:predicted Zn finger-like uncharacterized protein